MHTGDYIRSVKFDYAMRGYKASDVEMFLDEVAEDFDKLVAQNRALNERLQKLMKDQEEQGEAAPKAESAPQPAPPQPVDNSACMENVQGILVTAQRFSDQIINEANEKAAAILLEANTKAKEIDEKVATVLNAFEKDIAERRAAADSEITKMLNDAAVKSEGIITAAHDSVARQQLLFDKLKVEVSEFKKMLFDNHKQQLEVLQKFPDSVPYDPERAAKALEFEVDSEPDFRSFLPVNSVSVEPEVAEAPLSDEPVITAEESVADEAAPTSNSDESLAELFEAVESEEATV